MLATGRAQETVKWGKKGIFFLYDLLVGTLQIDTPSIYSFYVSKSNRFLHLIECEDSYLLKHAEKTNLA